MYRSILVPLDGSAFGEQALPYALGLAHRAGAQLHLAHVHVPPAPLFAGANDAALRAAERTYFEGLEQRIAAHWDVPMTTMLLDGPVTQTLHEYALASEAELIVMTTHGRGALSRFWLGSIADALIRQVSIPMLLVRPGEQMLDIAHDPPIKRILIPLDGSALAEHILPSATALGRLMQAEYRLLHVVEPLVTAYGTELYTVVVDDQVIEELRKQGQAYVDQVATQLRAEDLEVQTATAVEQIAGAILGYAQAQAVDLIALTTHGRTGLARWFLGGVADKVIRGATMPVLLYRPAGVEEPA